MFNKKEKSSKDEVKEEEIKDLSEETESEVENLESFDIIDDVETDTQSALKEEIKNLDDRLKRTMAEFDNFRKRTIKEKSSMYDDGIRNTIEKILPVLDNFSRAILTNSEKSSFQQGIEMILKQFTDILNSMDVKEIEAQGKEFNPNFHLAVAHVEDESYESNTVIEVLQKGYIHKDKVIRYSTVKVAN